MREASQSVVGSVAGSGGGRQEGAGVGGRMTAKTPPRWRQDGALLKDCPVSLPTSFNIANCGFQWLSNEIVQHGP